MTAPAAVTSLAAAARELGRGASTGYDPGRRADRHPRGGYRSDGEFLKAAVEAEDDVREHLQEADQLREALAAAADAAQAALAAAGPAGRHPRPGHADRGQRRRGRQHRHCRLRTRRRPGHHRLPPPPPARRRHRHRDRGPSLKWATAKIAKTSREKVPHPADEPDPWGEPWQDREAATAGNGDPPPF